MEIEIETENMPETREDLEKQALTVVDRARAMATAIKDEESYRAAGEFLKTVKGWRAKVSEYFKPLKDRTYSAWKEATGMEGAQDKPLAEAESALKSARAVYFEQEQRKSAIVAEQARKEAQRQAENEQIKRAEELAKSGNRAGAEAVISAPVVVAPVVIASVLKETGVSFRDLWSAEVTDLKALVQAVAAGTVPLCAIAANDKELNRLAKALKTEMNYPGVRLVCRKIESTRSI